jgi:hypothetical protein
MKILEKFDEFSNRKKNLKTEIDNQKRQNRQKMTALKKKKYDLDIEKIKKRFSKFVAGPSSYN